MTTKERQDEVPDPSSAELEELLRCLVELSSSPDPAGTARIEAAIRQTAEALNADFGLLVLGGEGERRVELAHDPSGAFTAGLDLEVDHRLPPAALALASADEDCAVVTTEEKGAQVDAGGRSWIGVPVQVGGDRHRRGRFLIFGAGEGRHWSAQDRRAVTLSGRWIDGALSAFLGERSLREHVERLELALLGTDLAMWDWDLRTNEVVNDERWAAMIGYTPEEIAADIALRYELIHPDDRAELRRRLYPHLKGETPYFEVTHRMRHKSGEWRWILDRGTVVERDASGRALRMAGTHRDLTQQKRAEEERRQLEAHVQQTHKLESLGLLAGGIAHDFNNLLTSVLGHAQLARATQSPDAEGVEHLEAIETTARRATDLARQLLAYAGKARMVVEIIDLNDMLTEMSHLLEVSISKKVRVGYWLAPDLGVVEADPTQLRQVVMNLITNASDAVGDSRGSIRVGSGETTLSRQQLATLPFGDELPAGRYLYFEVEDSGCGMSEETLERIFDPFFTTKKSGRGLGLAAVLGIVRGHRGTIEVCSLEGEGSRVRVLLPPAEGEAKVESARSEVAEEGEEPGGTVLVADDEEGVRRLVRSALEGVGFRVLLARDGKEALSLFLERGSEIDIVVLDLAMPGLGGEEVLREIRRRDRELPVVVCSGFSEPEVEERLHARDDRTKLLPKPYDVTALIGSVRAGLRRERRS